MTTTCPALSTPRYRSSRIRPFAGSPARPSIGSKTGRSRVSCGPVQPAGPRAGLVRSTWYVPQASSFWRRDVFDEFGLLREDLDFVFDTEFGLRLALEGVRPTPVGQTLAVRYLHPEAKSADRSRFDQEYKKVARQLRKRLTVKERSLDVAVRSLHASLRAQYLARKRLGLLHLRERWLRGRFARQ